LHPFKNLAVILTDEDLKKKFNLIFEKWLCLPVRGHFLEGYKNAFTARV